MGKLGKLLRKAMVISMEDQISYCNKTIQVGPHVLVVTTATVDTSGECTRGPASEWRDRRTGATTCTHSLLKDGYAYKKGVL